MTLPAFPDEAFPNDVSVVLCEDAGNDEGGYNPVAGSGVSFPASVQEKGVRWVDRGGVPVSVTQYAVLFQTDPTLTLSRPIRAGDQIVWAGDTLTTLGGSRDRGGYGWLWRVSCEHVST